MRKCAEAGGFDGGVEFFALWLELIRCEIGGDVRPWSPAYDDACEGHGDEKVVPGVQFPRAFGFEVKGSDGCTAHLGELDGAHFGLIDGAARAVGGEDGGFAGF